MAEPFADGNPERARELHMEIADYVVLQTGDDFDAVTVVTNRGDIEGRYYRSPNPIGGVIWLAGAIGGWHSPCRSLYPTLSRGFMGAGISSLWLQYRDATDFDECVLDVLGGLTFLADEEMDRAVFVGHSMGGAVAIQAAAHAFDTTARGVITLATQSYGAESVGALPDWCALLMLHGDQDRLLPPSCSTTVYDSATVQKDLHILPGADHNLDESADTVHSMLKTWIPAQLRREIPTV